MKLSISVGMMFNLTAYPLLIVQLFIVIGISAGFVIGAFVTWRTLALIGIVRISIILILCCTLFFLVLKRYRVHFKIPM
jgi:hypothetical protein